MLSAVLAGCVTAAGPAPITREEIADKVKCAELAAGVECSCVIDKAFAGYAKVPLTVLNETPANAAMSQAITRDIRASLAVKAAEDACAPTGSAT